MSEPYLTKPEVAAKLGVSPKSVQRHIRPSGRVGGQNRYLMSDVRRQTRGESEDLPDNVTPLRPKIGVPAA